MQFIGSSAPFGGSLWGGVPVVQRGLGTPARAPRVAQPQALPPVAAAAQDAVRQAEKDAAGVAQNYQALAFAIGEDKAALALAEARGSVAEAQANYRAVVGGPR